ncbi:MAG: 50S ribosomal protein L9 [Lentisphaeria bacterium]|nr:50S ribosomal protein L9 [Lentisphaeria bacterium]NLZ60283.1 50S ribosomal protein L9 [Lentisphaerota bacterium]
MAVEIILLEDVAGLGKIGEQVRVADGYARNYLFPRQLGQKLSPGLMRQIEAKKLRLQKEHSERLEVARSMADKIAGTALQIFVAVGDNDKLYGSVNSQMLAEALLEKGIEVERSIISLPEGGLRELGEHHVAVKLHAEIKASLQVNILKKED